MDFKLNKSNLNFRVYAAASLPETARENDICIISDVPVKNWVLSPDTPIGAPRNDGDVWIQYDVAGATRNILKTNLFMMSHICANQYINGAWVEKSARSYQNGAWVDWIDWSKWIVRNGIYRSEMVAEGKKFDTSFSHGTTFTVTKGDGFVNFEHGAYTGMVYWGPFDLTNATSLVIEGEFNINNEQPNYYNLTAWTSIGTLISQNRAGYARLSATGATLDVSGLKGEHYVGFVVRDTGSEKVVNFWLE